MRRTVYDDDAPHQIRLFFRGPCHRVHVSCTCRAREGGRLPSFGMPGGAGMVEVRALYNDPARHDHSLVAFLPPSGWPWLNERLGQAAEPTGFQHLAQRVGEIHVDLELQADPGAAGQVAAARDGNAR